MRWTVYLSWLVHSTLSSNIFMRVKILSGLVQDENLNRSSCHYAKLSNVIKGFLRSVGEVKHYLPTPPVDIEEHFAHKIL